MSFLHVIWGFVLQKSEKFWKTKKYTFLKGRKHADSGRVAAQLRGMRPALTSQKDTLMLREKIKL